MNETPSKLNYALRPICLIRGGRMGLTLFLSFLFLIFSVHPASASDDYPPRFRRSAKPFSRNGKGDIIWGVWYVPGVNIPTLMKWNSLENFINYHNHLYSGIIATPLPADYAFKPTFIQGLELNLMVLTLNTLWTKTRLDMESVYTNGDKRLVSVNYNTFQTGFDIDFPISIFRIGLCNGLNMNWGEFYSGYKYSSPGDSYVSYAQDVPMNGIYSTRRFFSHMLGGRIGVTWKFLKFVFKAQYMFPGNQERLALIPSYDKLFSTTPGFGYYSDGEIPNYFNYAPQDINNPNQNSALMAGPHKWFFTLQLGIGFTNNHNVKLKDF